MTNEKLLNLKLNFERKYYSGDKEGAKKFVLENPDLKRFVVDCYRKILADLKSIPSEESSINYHSKVLDKLGFLEKL